MFQKSIVLCEGGAGDGSREEGHRSHDLSLPYPTSLPPGLAAWASRPCFLFAPTKEPILMLIGPFCGYGRLLYKVRNFTNFAEALLSSRPSSHFRFAPLPPLPCSKYWMWNWIRSTHHREGHRVTSCIAPYWLAAGRPAAAALADLPRRLDARPERPLTHKCASGASLCKFVQPIPFALYS